MAKKHGLRPHEQRAIDSGAQRTTESPPTEQGATATPRHPKQQGHAKRGAGSKK